MKQTLKLGTFVTSNRPCGVRRAGSRAPPPLKKFLDVEVPEALEVRGPGLRHQRLGDLPTLLRGHFVGSRTG